MTMTRTVSAVLVAALATTAAPALAQNGDYDPRYADVDRAPMQEAETYGQTYIDYERAREGLNARRGQVADVVDDGHAYVVREDLADYRGQDQRAYRAAPAMPAAPVAPAYGAPAYGAPAGYGQVPAGYGAQPQYGAPAGYSQGPQYGIATGRIAPHLAYTMEQREDWLSDCHRLYEEEDNHSERRGLIGSLLGALVGGVAGNRIAGIGDRLGGSLIGAGVGGLAGAVIGGLFSGGGNRDRDDDRGYREIDECESYLLRYERSAQTNPGGQYGSAYGGQNVQWVRVPIQTTRNSCNSCRDVVVEEWVEEVAAPRQRARVIRKAAPVQKKTKRIKYSK